MAQAQQTNKELPLECDICCLKFNKTIREPVNCEYQDCGFVSCKKCIRTFILSSSDTPHCMNCKKIYSQRFMISKLNKSFISKKYRKHYEKILYEHEVSKFKDTMQLVDNLKNAEVLEEENIDLAEQIYHLQIQIRTLQRKQSDNRIKIYQLRVGSVKERKEFIMPCRNSGCNGFLSKQYKCPLCSNFTCSKCLEVIGLNKNDEEHVCNEDSIKTAEFIKKNTHPCPKCGVRIHKIDGCDQMWCTECKTAFSWNTGVIDEGVIHNPHFIQYITSRNGKDGEVEELENRVLNECNGHIPHVYDVYRGFRSIQHLRPFIQVHRIALHIENISIRELNQRINKFSDNDYLRAKFIMKNLEKEEFINILYLRDKQIKRMIEIRNIYELFVNIVGEAIKYVYNYPSPNDQKITQFIKNKYNEFIELKHYCNKQFEIISATHSVVAPYVTETWEIKSQKSSFKDIKELK